MGGFGYTKKANQVGLLTLIRIVVSVNSLTWLAFVFALNRLLNERKHIFNFVIEDTVDLGDRLFPCDPSEVRTHIANSIVGVQPGADVIPVIVPRFQILRMVAEPLLLLIGEVVDVIFGVFSC